MAKKDLSVYFYDGIVVKTGIIGVLSFPKALVNQKVEYSLFLTHSNVSNRWGVEFFNDKIYIAGFDGVATVDDETITPIDFGLGRKIPGYRLRAGFGQLFSVGNDDIVYFYGKEWKELVYPENKK